MHTLPPGALVLVVFCYSPYTQEYTDSNEWKEAYFMEYKMVSK